MNLQAGVLSEMVQKIRRCERAYIECFSERFENDRIIRYRDDNLSEMYDHNCTYIKGMPKFDDLLQIADEEIKLYRKENRICCKMLLDEMHYEEALKEFDDKLQFEQYGQYVFTPMEPPEWALKTECEIRKITGPAMVEDLVFLDKTQYEEACGEDFCVRRARRRGQVYLSNPSIESYICYYDGSPVGNCDLFLCNTMAKIEDFTVLPQYQHRGFGTAILKHLIGTAFSRGAGIVYLTTDEDDTPKEMYMKLGFEKVSESYAFYKKL